MKTILVENRGGRCHRWILGGATLAVCWGTAVAAVGLPASGDAGASSSWEQRAANDAGGELNSSDREFVAAALGACRQQAQLAATGVIRAAGSDVRSLAQQLATDYRSLADSLDAIWRRTGSAAEKTPGGVTESERGLADKSGAAFDREFTRLVTRGNSRILAAFEQAASTARDPGVRDLAGRHLPVLRAHRTTLTELNQADDGTGRGATQSGKVAPAEEGKVLSGFFRPGINAAPIAVTRFMLRDLRMNLDTM